MGQVVDITHKSDQLRLDIRNALLERGEARANLANSPVAVDEWRKAARSVARDLGRPIVTLARDNWVWAVLRDWPATPAEQAVSDAVSAAIIKGTMFR